MATVLLRRTAPLYAFARPAAGNGVATRALPLLNVAADVIEDGEGYTLQMALPGIEPHDVNIEFEDRVLTISGELKAAELPEGAQYRMRERAHGRFERTFRFGKPVNADAISATYNQGVLTLLVPHAAEARPRRITVQGEQQMIEG